MNRKKILFICGSMNQTTMMHEISRQLTESDLFFTPYYADNFLQFFIRRGLLDFTILGGKFRNNTLNYINENHLQLDYGGLRNDYDLVVTCSDLIIPNNIKNKKLILVQEGMTDPENLNYYIVRYLKLPRYLASTSMMGLSDDYDFFCVASEGYKNFFTAKGVKEEKIIVTGIPNFDNCRQYLKNDFPYRDYVLVCTSDFRETYKYENRKAFIQKAIQIAAGKKMIFKLHPNENFKRAEAEIKELTPDAVIFQTGNTNHMIANCDVLVTRYSSVVYIASALNKKVYSDIPSDELNELTPIQNKGTSAKLIAEICKQHLNGEKVERNINYMKYCMKSEKVAAA